MKRRACDYPAPRYSPEDLRAHQLETSSWGAARRIRNLVAVLGSAPDVELTKQLRSQDDLLLDKEKSTSTE